MGLIHLFGRTQLISQIQLIKNLLEMTIENMHKQYPAIFPLLN